MSLPEIAIYNGNLPKLIIYNGRKYRLQTTERYYQDQNRSGVSERLLHRVIWSEYNGPIPEGHCVHHKNGKWWDNDIDNLELIESKEHAAIHLTERWNTPSERVKLMRGIKERVEAATEWHRSEKGHEWHTENTKRQWANRIKTKTTCKMCGTEFLAFFPSRARFCSGKCQAKAFRLRKEQNS